jgi:hypothetical protein
MVAERARWWRIATACTLCLVTQSVWTCAMLDTCTTQCERDVGAVLVLRVWEVRRPAALARPGCRLNRVSFSVQIVSARFERDMWYNSSQLSVQFVPARRERKIFVRLTRFVPFSERIYTEKLTRIANFPWRDPPSAPRGCRVPSQRLPGSQTTSPCHAGWGSPARSRCGRLHPRPYASTSKG